MESAAERIVTPSLETAATSEESVPLQRSGRPPDSPTSLAEWLWYVRRYERGIYVRTQNAEGRWVNASLAELNPKEWGEHIARWLDEGGIPCRVLEEGERRPTAPDQRPLK